MNKSIRFKITDFKFLSKALLPQKKEEKLLFFILLLIYLSYSIYIALSTSVIDNMSYETDIYFSYDNPLILMLGRTQISGHPLLMLFYYPFVLIGNGLAYLVTFKAKTLLFVLLSSSMISMSSVYIFRYLREIIEIKRSVAYLITLFFAFFSTNLLLSFTPESFTLSAIFLAFIMYTISPEATERNGDNLYLTSFFVFVGLFRYLQIIFVEERSGNPTLILLKDNFIRIIIILWIISFFVITKFFR